MLLNDTTATPIIYRDIMMNPMTMMNPYMGYGGVGGFSAGTYTNLKPLSDDGFYRVEATNERETKSTIKTAGKIMAFCLAIGTIPLMAKYIKGKGGLGAYLKNAWNTLIGKTPTPQAPTPAPNTNQGWFKKAIDKVKNVFKKNPNQNQNANQGWFQKVVSKVKNIFKKNSNP